MKAFEELNVLLTSHSSLNLWIFEYGLTHERIKFVLFENNFFDRYEVSCIGCTYIQGKIKGGPYQLFIDKHPSQDAQDPTEIIIIRSSDEKLILKFEEILSIKPFEKMNPA